MEKRVKYKGKKKRVEILEMGKLEELFEAEPETQEAADSQPIQTAASLEV